MTFYSLLNEIRRLLCIACLVALAVVAPSGATPPADDPLTPAERQWLDAHPIIRLAPTPDYEPTEFFDEQGIYRGITADIVAKIEERLGIEFQVVRNETWAETIEELRSGEVDSVPIASRTPEREAFLVFGSAYISVSLPVTRYPNSRLRCC